DGVEDFDFSVVARDQPFNKIKLIDFSQAFGDIRQIPTFGRGQTTATLPIIGRPMTLKNVADGAQRRRMIDPAADQFAVDCHGPELAEVAFITQLLAQAEDQAFKLSRGSIMNSFRPARAVSEIHPIQSLFAGSA